MRWCPAAEVAEESVGAVEGEVVGGFIGFRCGERPVVGEGLHGGDGIAARGFVGLESVADVEGGSCFASVIEVDPDVAG